MSKLGTIYQDQSGAKWVLIHLGGIPSAHQANNNLLMKIGKKGKMLIGTRNLIGVSEKTLQTSHFYKVVGDYPDYAQDFRVFKTTALKNHWLR